MATDSLSPRRAALTLLGAVISDGLSVQEAAPSRLAALPPDQRARAQRLAVDVLRRFNRCEQVLKPYLRKPPPVFVQNVLRLATSEIHGDGAAAYGVVNDAVAMVRGTKSVTAMAGLVNAVLRKVAAEGGAAWQSSPPTKLPKWLRGRIVKNYGTERTAAMEAAHELGAPLDLTLRGGEIEGLEGERLPSGSLRLTAQGQVTAQPGYAEGTWWVQDVAAALPAKLLNPAKGKRVLDLCAAPGGKTMQMAAIGAHVTAVDSDATRMLRLKENLARTGLAAKTIVKDALNYTSEDGFDAILLDAPCSATGTLRRHPDLPFVKDGKGLRDLYALQSALLDHALTLLTPNGRLMFCTCSLLPEEGERQIEAALERHSGLEVVPLDHDFIEDSWRSPEGGLRLTPDMWADRGGLDGFYMALIRNPG